MVDLTSGAPEEINLEDDEGRAMIASGELWRRLHKYQEEEYLLGCAYICDGDAEVDTGTGIVYCFVEKNSFLFPSVFFFVGKRFCFVYIVFIIVSIIYRF